MFAPFEAVRAAVTRYIHRGFAPVPVPFKEKGSKLDGWPDLRLTEAEVGEHFPADEPSNVGLILGEASGGLVDIDLDCPEAIALAPAFLPPTDMVSGRASAVRSHWWYRAPGASYTKFKAPDGALVELRGGDRFQTVVPPSVHPSGEEVVWHDDGDPATVEAEELHRAVSHLAAASYLARCWPVEGSRQDFAGAVAGFLLRGGLETFEVEHIIGAAAEQAGDDEVMKRAEYVAPTAAKLAASEDVTGGPRMAELADDDALPDVLARWLKFGVAIEPTEVVAKPAQRPSVSAQIVRLAGEAEYFRDPDKRSFARIPVNGHHEVWPLNALEFRSWLTLIFWEATGRPASRTALTDAVAFLEAQASFGGDERELGVRVARHDEAIYIDLADSDWRAVRVDREGWEIVTEPPVMFRRFATSKALPEPVPGGSLDELRSMLTIDDDGQWRLVVAWLINALVPGIPHPVLVLTGEQGAAKTTTMRWLGSLFDPQTVDAQGAPRTVEDLLFTAAHSWFVGFDNLSYLRFDVSDELCRIVTGSGGTKRQLYTDDGVFVYRMQRVLALTGIENVVQRDDLADRSLYIELRAITPAQRRPIAELDEQFSELRPRVFGALLDTLSAAMAIEREIEFAELPRMADFARWGAAVERVLDWPHGTFAAALADNREVGVIGALEAEPVAVVLLAWMQDQNDWTGSATQLLLVLRKHARFYMSGLDADRVWPRQPNKLSERLGRVVPSLRHVGLLVEIGRRSGHRQIDIRWARGRRPRPPQVPTSESIWKTEPNLTPPEEGDGRRLEDLLAELDAREEDPE